MPLLQQVLAPTNIDTDGFSFGPPQVMTLANGNFAVTYSSTVDVFFQVFDPLGQFVTGGEATGNDFSGFGTAIVPVSGGFALAWDDGIGIIYSAVYTEQGQVVAAALPVSTDPGFDIFPMMTSLSGGGYAVVWQHGTSADSEIYTAIYDALGQPVAGPINVTESPTVLETLDPISGHRAANVVGLSTGGYALAWWGSDGANNEIYTAVYSELGVEIAAPVNVSQDAGDDSGVRIAALSTGGYALVWLHNSAIHTAVYDAAGNEVAPPTPVGSGSGDMRIAALAGGDYALFWSDGVDVYTAVYDNQGQEVSAPVNVSNGLGLDSSADITVLSNGAYALTWTSDFAGVGDDDLDLFTAVYTAQGDEAVGPVNVTQSPGVNDFFPATTALADGAYAITWNSGDQPYTAVYQFVPSPPPADVTYDGVADISLDLSDLINLGGSLTISNNDNLATIDLSNLISIGGNFTLSNNGALLTISMPNLPSVGGALIVSGETGVVDMSVSSAGSVSIEATDATGIVTLDVGSAGSVSVGGNTTGVVDISVGSAGSVSVGGNTTGSVTIGAENVTGSVSVEGTGATGTVSLDVGSAGSVSVTGNDGVIDTGGVENVTGVVSITGNSFLTIDLSALIAAGAIVIADNGVVTLDLSALVSVGGDVTVVNNGNLLTVDMPNLATVAGDVTIQTSHTTINLGSLDTVTGNVTIAAGPNAISFDASALGPGGGTVTMDGGSNVDTTITIGALANMAGPLTISGAGGVTLTAQAGLAEIAIAGTDSNDTVTGSATATNAMDGGGGNDTLTAGAGNDRVNGGTGDDTIVGGHGGGDDIYDGGADIDTVIYASTTLGVTVDLATGTASGAETGSDTLIDIENVTGGAGDDIIAGNAQANALDGVDGSDTVIFTGLRSDYLIEATEVLGQYRVTDNRVGGDGIDIVTGFEQFQFSDVTLAAADILNTAPVADGDGPYGVDEDALLGVDAVNGVLAGDSDLEGNPLTAVLGSGPAHALNFTLNADGSFSYQGAANFNGQDSFTYRAFDGTAFSDEITVQIDVAPVNDAPTAAPDTGSAGENETKSFDVLANDTDPDAGDSRTLVSIDAVSVSSANAAVNGIAAAGALSVVGNQIQLSPGTLFDPLNAGEMATVVVNYTMRDAAGAASSSALTLTVNGAAEGPVYNIINGTPGNDRLNGTAGADLISGFAGHDVIDAKAGDDLIVAGAGQDAVVAGSGDDTVVATINDGNDLYLGESGSDTFDLSQTSAAATVNLGTTVFGITVNGIGSATSSQIGTDLLFAFENAIGGSGNDTITGDNLANVLRGGAGADTISGLRADDRLYGDAGNDRLIGGRGSDSLNGGLDSDTFVFQAAQSQAGDVDVIGDFVVSQDHLLLQGLSVTALAELDVNSDSVLDTSLTLNDGSVVHLLNVNGIPYWQTLL